jgi:hypothetical protein
MKIKLSFKNFLFIYFNDILLKKYFLIQIIFLNGYISHNFFFFLIIITKIYFFVFPYPKFIIQVTLFVLGTVLDFLLFL